MEGLDTFADMMTCTHTQHWYKAIQNEVARHVGADQLPYDPRLISVA